MNQAAGASEGPLQFQKQATGWAERSAYFRMTCAAFVCACVAALTLWALN